MTTCFRASWILTCLMMLVGAGCCCTQGMNTCNNSLSCSSCPTGGCGSGPLLGLASCRGGCGETYVDEWVSEPPCIDDCGYCDSGCNNCRRPLRSVLKLLWGTPYHAACGCSSGCDSGCASGGCSSCDGDVVAFSGGPVHTSTCNCGGSHASMNHGTTSAPVNSAPNHGAPAGSGAGSAVPTPAPVAPSSAKRLSPAKQRATVAHVSTH